MNDITPMRSQVRGPASSNRRDTFTADRNTAVQLLRSCFAAEISCFAEISRYVRDDSASSRALLEKILEMEREHAEQLAGMLQIHRLSTLARKARASSETQLRTAASL
jgi:rubrerythrin